MLTMAIRGKRCLFLLAPLTLILLLLGSFSNSVHAMSCAHPSPGMTPPNNSVLAPNSVSYVFLSSIFNEEKIVVAVNEREVAAEIKLIHQNRIKVYSVRPVEVFPEYEVYVFRDHYSERRRGGVTARYFTSEEVAPTESHPVQIASREHNRDQFSDNQIATPNLVAPAYRVEWAYTLSDYTEGRRESAIVPTNMDVIWRRKSLDAKIVFGHESCNPRLLPNLEEGMFVGIATMASDGSYDVSSTSDVPSTPMHTGQTSSKSWLLVLGGLLLGLLAGSHYRRLSLSRSSVMDATSIPQVVLVAGTVFLTASRLGELPTLPAYWEVLLAMMTGSVLVLNIGILRTRSSKRLDLPVPESRVRTRVRGPLFALLLASAGIAVAWHGGSPETDETISLMPRIHPNPTPDKAGHAIADTLLWIDSVFDFGGKCRERQGVLSCVGTSSKHQEDSQDVAAVEAKNAALDALSAYLGSKIESEGPRARAVEMARERRREFQKIYEKHTEYYGNQRPTKLIDYMSATRSRTATSLGEIASSVLAEPVEVRWGDRWDNSDDSLSLMLADDDKGKRYYVRYEFSDQALQELTDYHRAKTTSSKFTAIPLLAWSYDDFDQSATVQPPLSGSDIPTLVMESRVAKHLTVVASDLLPDGTSLPVIASDLLPDGTLLPRRQRR